MKTTIFIISITLLSATCCGKELDSSANTLRPGDRLTEQRIVFQDMGRSGENVLWNLGDVEVVDGRYKLRYAAVNDSLHDWIAGTEHRTMYYYDQSAGDGIRIAGLENHTTLIHYDTQEMWLPLPMQPGDSVSGIFAGRGSYCGKVFQHAFGRYTTKADAVGTLILPDGERLTDVLRVRTDRYTMTRETEPDTLLLRYGIDSMAAMSADTALFLLQQAEADSTAPVMHAEILRWYAPGYRYPVLTTYQMVMTPAATDSIAPQPYTTAFYCPPSVQEEMLKDDPDNEAVRQTLADANAQSGAPATDNAGLTYNAVYNSATRVLHVDYSVERDATLALSFYSLMGEQVYHEAPHTIPAGTYSLDIPVGTHSSGFYVLTIMVNDIPTGETIAIQ